MNNYILKVNRLKNFLQLINFNTYRQTDTEASINLREINHEDFLNWSFATISSWRGLRGLHSSWGVVRVPLVWGMEGGIWMMFCIWDVLHGKIQAWVHRPKVLQTTIKG